MNDDCEKTIQKFGARSSSFALGLAMFFAMLGSGMVIFFDGSAIWGAWIPFCFVVIPSIHSCCREALRLRQRIAELERRLDER